MAEENKSKLNIGVGDIIGGVQLVKDLFTNKKKQADRDDKRQLTQQGKLNELNAKTAKEMADYEQGLKMKMWKDTNYSAQLAEAEKAGVSKVAVLGGGGASTGQGASVGNVGGGNADTASATAMSRLAQQMQMAQIANLTANTEKTKAEADKIGGVDTDLGKANVTGKTIENNIASALQEQNISKGSAEADIAIMNMQEKNALWESLKTAIGDTSLNNKNNPLVKKQMAELETSLQNLESLKQDVENKKKTGKLLDDDHDLKMLDKQVNDFKAVLTKMGLNPDTVSLINTVLKGLFGMKGGNKPSTPKTSIKK